MQQPENNLHTVEIIPAPVAAAIAIPSKPIKVAGHIFAPVIFGKTEMGRHILHKLSQREAKFLAVYCGTWSLKKACEEIGLEVKRGERYLNRKHVRTFVLDQLKQKALANGVSVDYLVSRFREAFDGTVVLSEGELEAGKVLARLLKPSAPAVAVTLNQQTNNFNSANNPYENMTKDQLLGEIGRVAQEIDIGNPPPGN